MDIDSAGVHDEVVEPPAVRQRVNLISHVLQVAESADDESHFDLATSDDSYYEDGYDSSSREHDTKLAAAKDEELHAMTVDY